MRKGLISALLVLLFLMPLIPSLPAFLGGEDFATGQTEGNAILDFHSLTSTFGADIPVVAEFAQPLTKNRLAELNAAGVKFALGSLEMSRVGEYYVLRGSADGLSAMQDNGVFRTVSLQTPVGSIHPTRDVSIPEIQADAAWAIYRRPRYRNRLDAPRPLVCRRRNL
ncbi:MAG: hypothetical protein ACXABY_26905 [Candidatus Thorarchaeota archaeon]